MRELLYQWLRGMVTFCFKVGSMFRTLYDTLSRQLVMAKRCTQLSSKRVEILFTSVWGKRELRQLQNKRTVDWKHGNLWDIIGALSGAANVGCKANMFVSSVGCSTEACQTLIVFFKFLREYKQRFRETLIKVFDHSSLPHYKEKGMHYMHL